MCDEHSRGRRDGDRICDDCCTRLVRQDFKESDEEAHLFKLKMLLELSSKAKEEQRQELLSKEADANKLTAQMTNLKTSRVNAEMQSKEQISQEVQRNEKQQQVLSSLQQAYEDAKASKQTLSNRVYDVEGQVEAIRQEISIVNSQLAELHRTKSEQDRRLQESVKVIEVKEIVCTPCKRQLKHHYQDTLLQHVNEDILTEFFGDCDILPPVLSSSAMCNCAMF
jgi:chromosome segregation ATPase